MKKKIDHYDLFVLMGADRLTKSEKQDILQGITKISLEKFLIEQLDKTSNLNLSSQLRGMAANQVPIENVMEVLQTHNPSFSRDLVVIVRREKKDYLLEYFNQTILSLLKKQEFVHQQNASREQLVMIEQEISKYKTAEDLANKEEWAKLTEIFTAIE